VGAAAAGFDAEAEVEGVAEQQAAAESGPGHVEAFEDEMIAAEHQVWEKIEHSAGGTNAVVVVPAAGAVRVVVDVVAAAVNDVAGSVALVGERLVLEPEVTETAVVEASEPSGVVGKASPT
jgi:F420-dependent methylenetetrahydromethanopterin dehydrogenase